MPHRHRAIVPHEGVINPSAVTDRKDERHRNRAATLVAIAPWYGPGRSAALPELALPSGPTARIGRCLCGLAGLHDEPGIFSAASCSRHRWTATRTRTVLILVRVATGDSAGVGEGSSRCMSNPRVTIMPEGRAGRGGADAWQTSRPTPLKRSNAAGGQCTLRRNERVQRDAQSSYGSRYALNGGPWLAHCRLCRPCVCSHGWCTGYPAGGRVGRRGSRWVGAVPPGRSLGEGA